MPVSQVRLGAGDAVPPFGPIGGGAGRADNILRKSPRLARCLARAMAVACLLAGSHPAGAAPMTDGGAESAPVESAFLSLQQLDQRVADIGWRILAANLAVCPEQGGATGIVLHAASQYSRAVRKDAVRAFGLDAAFPSILAVAKDSPAAKAGILRDDILLAIDDRPMAGEEFGHRGRASYDAVDQAMRRLESMPAGRAVTLRVRRGAETRAIDVVPRQICRTRIELAPSGDLNSSANGDVAQINGRMLLWLRNDDEIALVIGHEVAHNILGHNQRIASERLDTGLVSALGLHGGALRGMEYDADALGTWLAANAGYEYRIAPDLWKRLTAAAGLAALLAATHPSPGDRAARLERVVTEIDARLAGGRIPSYAP